MTLGVNVGWVGSYRPEDIAASGAKAVRCTYQPSVPLVHGRAWMGALQALGVDVLMLLDNDAHWWGQDDPWRAGVGRAADEYEDLWTWVQVLNEPDAGWHPGSTEFIEERAAAHPSSWVLNPLGVSARLITAREMLGPNAYIIGPGLTSGHADWADQVDWSPVNELAVHPYAKAAYSPELRDLLEGYRKHGKPIRVTEYDSRAPEMHQCLADWGYNAFAFTWQDGGDIPDGIGMHDHQGNPKPSYHDFVAAAGAPPIITPPMEVPIPEPPSVEQPYYQLGFLKWAKLEPWLLGDPLELEHGAGDGWTTQRTSRGRLQWIAGVGHGFVDHEMRLYRWQEDWTASQEVAA